jgi:hypothetical protein
MLFGLSKIYTVLFYRLEYGIRGNKKPLVEAQNTFGNNIALQLNQGQIVS